MKVIVKQQAPGNDPVETVWCGGAGPADAISVMNSVAQLLDHERDDSPWNPKMLEIRITF
jgi:hypothetical protein